MRSLLAAASTLLFLVCPTYGITHFSGKWVLDLHASSSPHTIRTFWSEDGTQLISDISFRTEDSRDAQMTVVRELTDEGKTLVWSSTLKIAGESGSWTLRHVWRKVESK